VIKILTGLSLLGGLLLSLDCQPGDLLRHRISEAPQV